MHVAYSDEWLTIIGFVGTFIALYLAAGFLLVRRFFSHAERIPPLGWTGKLILLLAGCGILAAGYALFVEPYSLEVTHIIVPIDGLPASSAPIRIVQIADLHCDAEVRLEEQIPPAVKKEHPDLIFFTGDAINSKEGFPNFYKLIKRIEGIAPLVAIKGDWDFNTKLDDPFGRAGLSKPTTKAIQTFTIRGADICVIGVPSGAGARSGVDQAPKNMPLILLTHGPDSDVVLNYNAQGIDLICCGHTHGGQIALPGYGALITQSQSKRKYASGMNRVGDTPIYTSRGIGMEGHFPRVRFCAKPELTVFELVPSGKPRQSESTPTSGI